MIAPATHIVVENGFGKHVHRHPFTREVWTDATAREWQRKCAGRDRCGGVYVEIRDCDCASGEDA